MGYQIAGWAEFVVEIQFVSEEDAASGLADFANAVDADPDFERLPVTVGGHLLGAMVEGQFYSALHIRVGAPAATVGASINKLHQLAREAFPRNA